mmetsp:Transcript_16403/g.27789  ORF Transcript_16403/g.27789 Transcript_16403/m.27789 type:complete len:113 (+) Transcript_16403:443-781(+)
MGGLGRKKSQFSKGEDDQLIKQRAGQTEKNSDRFNLGLMNDNEQMMFQFELSKIVATLKKQGFAITNSFINYYSDAFKVNVNCGPDPLSQHIIITPQDLLQRKENYFVRLIF